METGLTSLKCIMMCKLDQIKVTNIKIVVTNRFNQSDCCRWYMYMYIIGLRKVLMGHLPIPLQY